MIKVFCDKCGADCDRVAFDVRIGVLHNPTPMYIKDLGEPHITDDHTRIRFTLCTNCYREEFHLPNVYISSRENHIVWRDQEEEGEDNADQ